MERKLKWNKKAIQHFKDQLFWYEMNRGHDFAVTFSENIRVAIDVIWKTPTIGKKEYVINKRAYRSFINHPRCRIFYWYSSKEVRIVDILLASKLH